MRPVTHDYQSLNEYTLPLQGKPYYRSSGIIYAVDRNGNKYAVGRVDLERFDDQNFQLCAQPRVCSLTGGNPVYPRPNQPDISESWDGISNGI